MKYFWLAHFVHVWTEAYSWRWKHKCWNHAFSYKPCCKFGFESNILTSMSGKFCSCNILSLTMSCDTLRHTGATTEKDIISLDHTSNHWLLVKHYSNNLSHWAHTVQPYTGLWLSRCWIEFCLLLGASECTLRVGERLYMIISCMHRLQRNLLLVWTERLGGALLSQK